MVRKLRDNTETLLRLDREERRKTRRKEAREARSIDTHFSYVNPTLACKPYYSKWRY